MSPNQNFIKTLLNSVRTQIIALTILAVARVSLEFIPIGIASPRTVSIMVSVTGVFIVAWAISRMLGILFRQAPFLLTLSSGMRDLFLKISRFMLAAIAALIILDTLGISITPILASLGVGSVAVALALQDTLGNWFSGIYILIDKPFEVGDQIRLDSGFEGTVIRIGWRSTQIKTGSNNIVVIPNSKVSSSLITNFNLGSPEVIFNVELTVPLACNLDKVQQICESTAKQLQTLSSARFVGFTELGAKIETSLRADRFADQADLRNEFIKRVHGNLQSSEIKISVKNT